MAEQLDQNISGVVNSHIGKRLLIARALRGISREKLAERLSVDCSEIERYEDGINIVSVSRLFELSMIFEVPLYYFFIDLDETLAQTVH